MRVSELYLRQLVRSSLAKRLISEADELEEEEVELSSQQAAELDALVDDAIEDALQDDEPELDSKALDISPAKVGRELSQLIADSEYISTEKKPAGRVIRMYFDVPPTDDLLNSALISVFNDDLLEYTPLRRYSLASGKYLSATATLSDGEDFTVVAVTRKPMPGSGGTAGPGENELVDIITQNVSDDPTTGRKVPIDVVIGGETFKDVTGVRKPERAEMVDGKKTLMSVGGEPKIDVLLLTGDGQPHPHGGLSLKQALAFGGAPSYEGWSRIDKHFEKIAPDLYTALYSELSQFVKDYSSNFATDPGTRGGKYEYPGINATRSASADAKQIALYGINGTAGAGLDSGHHLVTVLGKVSGQLDTSGPGNDVLYISGMKVYPEGHIPGPDSGWEPMWLIRGAKGRSSMGIDNARIALVPRHRAQTATEI